MSLIVTGANVNDLTKLNDVLTAIVVKRPQPTSRRSKHLCADAGYRSKSTAAIIESHGYIPHVVDRRQEKEHKRRDPTKKARRWVVEVCHSWFNRFRKLLVRYEKLERSFVALNHLAAAIIALRKVPLTVNIIHGQALSPDRRKLHRSCDQCLWAGGELADGRGADHSKRQKAHGGAL